MNKSPKFICFVLFCIFVFLSFVICFFKEDVEEIYARHIASTEIYKTLFVPKNNKSEVEKIRRKITKYKLYNFQNVQISEKLFDQIKVLSNKNFLVSQKNLFGVINQSGQFIIPMDYLSINYSKNTDTYLAEKEKKFLLDNTGKTILNAQNIFFLNGYIIAENNGSTEIYDDKMKKISSFKNATNLGFVANGKYVKYSHGNKMGISDLKGNVLFPPLYDYINLLCKRNGIYYFIAGEKIDDSKKYGIVNSQKKVIIPFVFSIIQNVRIKNKQDIAFICAVVEKNSDDHLWAAFDINGKFISEPDMSIFKREFSIDTRQKRYTIVNIYKKKEEQTFKLLTKEQYEKLLLKSDKNTQKSVFYKSQQKHKTNYKSDFYNNKIKGVSPKLECSNLTYFCKLSPNGLSAKYNGSDSFYVSNKSFSTGKYYFEFQIDTDKTVSSKYKNKFSLISSLRNENDSEQKSGYFIPDLKKYDIDISNEMVDDNKIVGVAIDFDKKEIFTSVNGDWKQDSDSLKNGISFKNISAKSYNLGFSVAGYTDVLTINFGNIPFKYKVPKGYISFKGQGI